MTRSTPSAVDVTAENIAAKWASRARSRTRWPCKATTARDAIEAGYFKEQIVRVMYEKPQKRSPTSTPQLHHGQHRQAQPRVRQGKRHGGVTPRASTTPRAAVSWKPALPRSGLEPSARLVAYAHAALIRNTWACAGSAAPLALKKAGLTVNGLDVMQ